MRLHIPSPLPFFCPHTHCILYSHSVRQYVPKVPDNPHRQPHPAQSPFCIHPHPPTDALVLAYTCNSTFYNCKRGQCGLPPLLSQSEIPCLPGKLPCKAGFHTSDTDIRPDKSYFRSGSVSALQAWYPASKNCSPPFSRPAYATIPAAPLPPAVKPPWVHLTALPRSRPHRSDGFYFYRSGNVPVHTAIPPEIPQGSAQTTGSAAHNLCPHGVP